MGKVVPQNETGFNRRSYDYCTKNWCIRTPEESLFKLNQGPPLSFLQGCDEPYEGDVDLSKAPAALKSVCKGDRACLWDGIVTGNLNDARAAVSAREDFENDLRGLVSTRGPTPTPIPTSTTTPVFPGRGTFVSTSFAPAYIFLNTVSDIKVSITVRTRNIQFIAKLSHFNLYKSASPLPSTAKPILKIPRGTTSAPSFGLYTTVYSANLKVGPVSKQSFLGYIAYPVIDGGEQRSSSLTQTSPYAIVVSQFGNLTSPEINNVREYKLLIATFPFGGTGNVSQAFAQSKVKSSYEFLGKGSIAGCGPKSEYISSVLPNLLGNSYQTIEIGRALEDGKWKGQTKVLVKSIHGYNEKQRHILVAVYFYPRDLTKIAQFQFRYAVAAKVIKKGTGCPLDVTATVKIDGEKRARLSIV